MSALFRPAFRATTLLPTTARRTFITTPMLGKTATDSAKDALKSTDRAVSDTIVAGIEKGQEAAGKAKEVAGVGAQKAEGAASQATGEVKGKAAELKGEAKGAYAEGKGKIGS